MIVSRKHHHNFDPNYADSEGTPGTPTDQDLKPVRVLDKLRLAHRQQFAIAVAHVKSGISMEAAASALLQWTLDRADGGQP